MRSEIIKTSSGKRMTPPLWVNPVYFWRFYTSLIHSFVVAGNDSGTGWIAVKSFVYLIVMFILFIGISIISDIFMAAIEVITSNEKQITILDSNTGKNIIDRQTFSQERMLIYIFVKRFFYKAKLS